MNTGGELSAEEALQEIGRMRRHVGRSTRWLGWLYLTWGLAAVAYWTAMYLAPRPYPTIAAIGWVAMTVLTVVYSYRQGVYGPDHTRLTNVLTGAWIVTMLTAMVVGAVMPDDPSGWWVAVGLVAAVVAALPMLYGAWRVRPWKAAR
ncbi:hypothetical protein [Sphaerisporangium sp. TRM90804]|uniref:hypothetical protein n=1 Tax=Sphaerisporangium sp. TRM90804 TaxID=3031113 RepID=UPI0024473D91|nr:hypothetical protein [Sphaerisporangium sp. TRM90804]MDH2429720.1 hypothetical protein [Sphaerisporangium sp. TRM90804]